MHDCRVISYPAPELCQFADEELIHSLGELVYPGFIERSPGENGLRLWVEGSRPEDKSRDVARFQFQSSPGSTAVVAQKRR